jgi:hypothetical protein
LAERAVGDGHDVGEAEALEKRDNLFAADHRALVTWDSGIYLEGGRRLRRRKARGSRLIRVADT